MAYRWEPHGSRLERVALLRDKLRITIYGSYQPEGELAFLEAQRDLLIGHGYSDTILVKEYHERYPSLKPLDASKDCLYGRDVHYFIFTKGGRNLGVTRELQIAATDERMAPNRRQCVVFDQTSDGHSSLSALSIDDVENSRMVKRDFVGEEDLQDALPRITFSMLLMMQCRLQDR